MKYPFHMVSAELDRLFMQPFSDKESEEDRAQAIESYMERAGYNWNSYIEALLIHEFNEIN